MHCQKCHDLRMIESEDPNGDVMNTPCPDCNGGGMRCQKCGTDLEFDAELAEWMRQQKFDVFALCDDCQQQKRQEAVALRQEQAKNAREQAAMDFIPERYRNAEIGRFPAKIANALGHAFENGVGLIFHGASHVGKTTAAYAIIAARIADGTLIGAEVIRGSALANLVMDSFSSDPVEKDGAKNLMRRLKNTACLFLDDIDKVRPTEATIEFLFELLEYRACRKLPIVVTTQATGDKLAELLRDRKDSTAPAAIVERLRSLCKPIGIYPETTKTEK